jgi:hypothetical protein
MSSAKGLTSENLLFADTRIERCAVRFHSARGGPGLRRKRGGNMERLKRLAIPVASLIALAIAAAASWKL